MRRGGVELEPSNSLPPHVDLALRDRRVGPRLSIQQDGSRDPARRDASYIDGPAWRGAGLEQSSMRAVPTVTYSL